MADDEKRLKDSEPEENKDWQWDAAAQTLNADFLEVSVPEKESEEEQESIPAEENETKQPLKKSEQIKDSDEDGEAADDSAPSDIPPGHCIICGQKIRSGKSELYCDECRTKYLKVDYGATHIILSIVMVFIAVIGIVMFASTAKITKAIHKADVLLDEGKISAAEDEYYNVENTVNDLNLSFNSFLKGISSNIDDVTFYNSGRNIQKKEVMLYAKTFSIMNSDNPNSFISFADAILTEKELNSAEFAQVKGLKEYLKRFIDEDQKLSDAIAKNIEELNGVLASGSASEKELKEQKDKILAAIEKCAKENNFSDGTTAFLKYWFLSSTASYGIEATDEEYFDYISATYKDAGEYGYIYFDIAAQHALDCNKFDEALKITDEVLKTNPSSATAYYYKSLSYLYSEKFDDALTACEKAAELSTSKFDTSAIKANILRRKGEFAAAIDICNSVSKDAQDSEILRQEAIAYYLSGDEDNALKYAKMSYESAYAASYTNGSISLEAANTSALIYKLCNDEEDYDYIVSSLNEMGLDLEEPVISVINGDMTFEDLFMKGKGDI